LASKGLCGICGKGGKLTDEHIPPDCAFNVHGLAIHTFADWQDAGGNPDQMKNAQPRPKGTLWATLCEQCNNVVLGSWYVPDFCRFVQGVAAAISRESKGDPENLRKAGPGPWIRIGTAEAIRPLCIVKVIAGMILALNADTDPSFRERHASLVEFVLNRDLPLPFPYRAYLAIHLGSYSVFAPTMFRYNKETSESIAFSAVENPPLAYILTFNEQHPDTDPFLPIGGLHNFGELAYDVQCTFEIDLLLGFRDSPVPGEYGQGEVPGGPNS